MRSRRPVARLAVSALVIAVSVTGGVAPTSVSAQGARPRVGVALGGGAARGFAHIGVLRWLEEHRVPVDVIGGTSMGGLVAAALATGLSPDDVTRLVSSLDWAQVLSPDSPFLDKSYRRKEDARAFPSLLQFGLKNGFHLPRGLSSAEPVMLWFNRLALPYYATRSFDDLAIPFRCVATDLVKSEQVVLASGRLDDALRATMAIPGIFAPVRLGDQVLVDGGVLNNVPADVVKGMGADVVIAVDVGADLSQERTDDSLLAVLADSLDTILRAGARRSLEPADVVITPNLKGLRGASFGRLPEFERAGYEAAEAVREVLLRYAVDERTYREHLAARRARQRTTVPQPAFLAVEGVTGAQAEVIRRQLRRYINVPLNPAKLERDLIALTGSDRYETVMYRLEEADGRVGLVVTAREKSHAPPYLLAAMDVYNTESSTVAAALRARVTFFDVLTPGSEVRLDGAVGQVNRIGAEAYLALTTRGPFVAPRVSSERANTNLFEGQRFAAEYRTEVREAGADLGYTAGGKFEIRTGYVQQAIRGDVRIGDRLLPKIGGDQRFVRAKVAVDTQTSPVVPRSGLYARAELRRFFETADVEAPAGPDLVVEPDSLLSGEAVASVFVPVSRRGRAFVSAAGGSSFGDTAVVNAFTLGGPFALGTLQRGELRGSNYAYANVGYLHEVARVLEGVLGRLYVGAWVEEGAAFERLEDAQMITNFSGGFIVDTAIGPASLMGSFDLHGRSRFYIGLGPFFRR